jgi:hypothetical protein
MGLMTLLSGGLSALLGRYLSTLTVPALGIGLLVTGHQLYQQREARQRAEATNICNAGWETEIRKQERDVARNTAEAAQRILVGERKVNEDLRYELDKLTNEIQAVRAGSTGTDASCLSDSVLNDLRRRQGSNSPGGHSRSPKSAPTQ